MYHFYRKLSTALLLQRLMALEQEEARKEPNDPKAPLKMLVIKKVLAKRGVK